LGPLSSLPQKSRHSLRFQAELQWEKVRIIYPSPSTLIFHALFLHVDTLKKRGLYHCSTVLSGVESSSHTDLLYTANRDKTAQDNEHWALHVPATAERISAGKIEELTAGWNLASYQISHLLQKVLIHNRRP